MEGQNKLDGEPLGEVFVIKVTEIHEQRQNIADSKVKKSTDKIESESLHQKPSLEEAFEEFAREFEPVDGDWSKLVLTVTRKDAL